jgi:hypothetical protein
MSELPEQAAPTDLARAQSITLTSGRLLAPRHRPATARAMPLAARALYAVVTIERVRWPAAILRPAHSTRR